MQMTVKSLSVVVVVGLSMLLTAQRAQAIPVGGGVPTTALPVPYSSDVASTFFGFSLPGWGIPPGTLPVELDPTAGSLLKVLDVPTGVTIAEGSTLLLVEFIDVAGTVPWTGWEEILASDGEAWLDSAAPVLPDLVDADTGLNPAGYSVLSTATSVAFSFDPIVPVDTLVAFKGLRFIGVDASNAFEEHTGPVYVVEYPVGAAPASVPEPITAASTALGGLALVLFGLRRRLRCG